MDNIEFSTDEFAREMNMSRSNLHLKLKAITGESTIDFIRKIRFNEAAKLLKDGRYTVAEVSTMVGFNTRLTLLQVSRNILDTFRQNTLRGQKDKSESKNARNLFSDKWRKQYDRKSITTNHS